MFDEVYQKIDQLLLKKSHIVIAIDGQAASGKTTLASKIKEKYQGEVIHMDDYFLRQHQRTIDRLNQISGNIDYERFEAEIINHLNNEYIKVVPFQCKSMTFDEPYIIKRPAVLVIEGAYSMRLPWIRFYDLKILVKIDYELQVSRIKKRNGHKQIERFVNEWIPMENKHIIMNDLEHHADAIIQVTNHLLD
ncbi:MAG: hypothetical protein RBT45_02990 [Acholeplasmataceae bacterium]|jgi:uridine kinase|nr:hypothetical protein [Acholeplasmataceae bacterium]